MPYTSGLGTQASVWLVKAFDRVSPKSAVKPSICTILFNAMDRCERLLHILTSSRTRSWMMLMSMIRIIINYVKFLGGVIIAVEAGSEVGNTSFVSEERFSSTKPRPTSLREHKSTFSDHFHIQWRQRCQIVPHFGTCERARDHA